MREQAVEAARLRREALVHGLGQRHVGQRDAIGIAPHAGRHRHFGAAIEAVHAAHHGHHGIAEKADLAIEHARALQQARTAHAAAGQHHDARARLA